MEKSGKLVVRRKDWSHIVNIHYFCVMIFNVIRTENGNRQQDFGALYEPN